MKPTARQFGQLLSRHPVDNRRRWVTGGVAAAMVVVGAFIVVLLIGFAPSGDTFGQLAGILLLAIVVGVPFAAIRLGTAARGGRGEVVNLYEHGITHRVRNGVRRWSWDQIATIRVPSAADDEGLRLSGLFGRGYRCTVHFTDGSRLRVDGMIDNSAPIEQMLRTHRPDAVSDLPGPWKRAAVWILPVVILGCCASIAYLIAFIAINDHEVETSPGVYEPGISDSEGVAIAIGMLAAITIGVLALAMFITTYTDIRRRRRAETR